jgi:hypothetical protein
MHSLSMGGEGGIWLGRALAGPTPVLGTWWRVHSHVVALAVAGLWGSGSGGCLAWSISTGSPLGDGGK